MTFEIYGTESVMRSLENLTHPISLFRISDEQKEEIMTKMSICTSCRCWKYNKDLLLLSGSEKICNRCSAKGVKPSKQTQETIYLSLKHSLSQGLDLSRAIKHFGFQQEHVSSLPQEWLEELNYMSSKNKGRTRKTFTTEFKKEVVRYTLEFSMSEAMTRYNVSQMNVYQWLNIYRKQKEE